VWKELSATAVAGLNEIEYDLSADPKRADAAEARAREKARAEQAKRDAEKKKEPETPPAPADDDEGGEPADAAASASGRPAIDAELERVLADPMRSTRRRHLPAGRYTVEMKAAGATATSTLNVKAPKEDGGSDDEGSDGDVDPDR
jgi:hypothetical protein